MLTLISDLFFKGILFFALHIKSNNSFPPALSPQDEKMYLQKFKNGDTEAKNKLIEHNLRLVAHIVKKYARDSDEADDLLSIGTIGLIKGINTFTTDKKTRLSTYVAKCIHNEILMVLRAKKHQPSEVSLSESIGCDKEGNEVTLMDILPSEEEEIEENFEKKQKIKKLYEGIKNSLDERERVIIEMRYGLNDGKEVPQRKIAKKLGISRSYVSRIEKKAIEKLKDAFENRD